VCPVCKYSISADTLFCPNCGSDLRLVVSDNQKRDLVEASTNNQVNPSYSFGIKLTLFGSPIISTITLLLYYLKNAIDTDTIATVLIQGVLARPLIVLFLAYLLNLIPKGANRKVRLFNLTASILMILQFLSEFFRWTAIIEYR
jgi:hypothetical protein